MAAVITEGLTYDYKQVYSSALPTVPASIELKHHWGFDAKEKFQRLAKGCRRVFSTKDGPVAGMTFALTGGSNCKIIAIDMSWRNAGLTGLVCIEGDTPGTGQKLVLQNASGKTVDAIDLQVVGAANGNNVRFYNLIDGKGRRAVSISPLSGPPASYLHADLDDLVDKVNSIVSSQADRFLFLSGSGDLLDLADPRDFGDRVDISKVNIFTFTGRDPGADYHVIFVWKIDGSHTNGMTQGNVTLLDQSLPVNQRPLTLAHEFVHFLSVTGSGHDSDLTDLMHITYPHGINLRKGRLRKMV
jgi:hypothetical protein